MQTVEQRQLVDRLSDPNVRYLNPFELARELKKFQFDNDIVGVLIMMQAYVKGVNGDIKLVFENMGIAAVLADRVNRDGYEAPGQFQYPVRDEDMSGPVAKFYIKTTVHGDKIIRAMR